MNCTDGKTFIALWVGGDLDESDVETLQRHLSSCQGCCEYSDRMHSAIKPLESEAQSTVLAGLGDDSLWPQLSTRLVLHTYNSRVRRFNGYVAGLAVAAMVLAMVAVSQQLPSSNTYVTEEPAEIYPGSAANVPTVPVGSSRPYYGPAGPVNVRELFPNEDIQRLRQRPNGAQRLPSESKLYRQF